MEKLIASISCSECKSAKFLIIQIENDLHLICIECGYISNVQETIVNQLKNAKKELGG